MALDKADQMAGGKPAGSSAAAKSAAAKSGTPSGSQNQGSQSSGGKMGASSSQTGGVKGGASASTGNTSKGGAGVSSGKMGAASSQTGGVKGGSTTGNTSKGGYSGPKGTPAGGLNNAARAAAAASGGKTSSNGGYSGPKGTPKGGLNAGAMAAAAVAQANARNAARMGGNYMSGRSPESLAAQARAVSRGPGVTQGTRPGGLSTPQAAQRTATSLGLAMAERYGLDPTRTVAALHQMAKTMVGEVGGLPPDQQAAAARSMFNRMDLAAANPAFRDAQYTTDPMGMLAAYDANGIRVPSVRNAGYINARPGTPGYADALAAVASGMSPYGSLQNAPEAVQNATHYHNPDIANPSWGRTGATPYGAHSFSNPDFMGSTVAAARNQVLGSPGGFGTLTPANPQMPALANAGDLASRIAALQAQQPQMGASEIPTPREQVNGFLGGMASLTPARPEPQAPTGFPAAQPNMNMAGYNSPMAGLTGMPQAPSNMNMSGYQSPMTGLSGMPQAPSAMGMAGYQSPMAAVAGTLQAGKMQDRLPESNEALSSWDVSQEIARNPYDTNYAPTGPVGWQSTGMSFNPGLAREGLPNPTGYGGPPGPGSYDPLSGIQVPTNNGFVGPIAAREGPYAGQASGLPADGLATAQPEEDPMERVAEYDPLSSIQAPQAPTTVAQAPPSRGWSIPSLPSIPGITEPLSPETKRKLQQAFDWAPYLVPPSPATMAARARHQATRDNASDRMAFAGRNNGTGKRRDDKKSEETAVGKLPWETTPPSQQPFGFAPPQLAQRTAPPFLWGSWA